MDQKIGATVFHGVNVFIFDWYWYEGKPLLEECINSGFLKANNDRMKYYIIWANHNATSYWDAKNPNKDSDYFKRGVNRSAFNIIVDHIVKNYFSQPSYYKIDSKPVFCICELKTFIDRLGSPEAAKEALDYSRKQTMEAGFPGLHLQGILWSALPSSLKEVPADQVKMQDSVLKYFGFNSLTNYCWAHLRNPDGDYEKWADSSTNMWKDFDHDFSIPYFPNVTVGWDANPRFLFKSGYINNSTRDKFLKYVKKAKGYASEHPNHKKLITINVWNKWSEGRYLEPDTLHGLKYLEALKKTQKDN